MIGVKIMIKALGTENQGKKGTDGGLSRPHAESLLERAKITRKVLNTLGYELLLLSKKYQPHKKINQVKYKTEIIILKQIFVTEQGAKIGYWRIKVVGTKMPLIWLFQRTSHFVLSIKLSLLLKLAYYCSLLCYLKHPKFVLTESFFVFLNKNN